MKSKLTDLGQVSISRYITDIVYVETNFSDNPDLFEKITIEFQGNSAVILGRFLKMQLLNLAGGIPEDNFTYFNFRIEVYSLSNVMLRVNSSSYELKRTVDLSEMEISNDSFVVNEEHRGNGIGTKVFLNQIREAKSQGFRLLTVYAMGGIDHAKDDGFDGFLHWGKYGYEMYTHDRQRFQQWAKERDCHSPNLYELLKFTDMYKVWKMEGFSWSGFFDLENKKHLFDLQQYLRAQAEKGFNYELWPEVFA